MNANLIAARQYLAAPADYFWRWSEGGEAVVWSTGETIAFRAELRAVLERIAAHGLPPLDEVLLVLAACRSSWRPSMDFLDPFIPSEELTSDTLPIFTVEAAQGLNRIHQLPPDLRESLEAKAVLVEVVFESRARRVWSDVAEIVLQILQTGAPPDQPLDHPPTRIRPSVLFDQLDILGKAILRVDEAALRLRRRSGLDQLPIADTAEPEPEQPSLRELLRSLSDDEELGGLSRMARQLMAVVDLPRRIAEPEDLPLGGVSDIANRGPLDRLLMSELAHDDLTLAVRVAVNEALYLRRESPPRTPPEQRGVLIDCGLRLWGVPRVFAAAVALALAANSEGKSPVAAWRNTGFGVTPVDLNSREGLVAHLEALEASIHPGESLPAFATELAKLGDDSEALVITDTETLDDPEFQRALADAAPPTCFLATVDRSGEFRLWQRSRGGKKLLREATLELKKILEPPKSPRPPRPLIDPDAASLPAILRQQPFPLRLPHRLDRQNMWKADDKGLYALTRDGRLMLWDETGRGARQVDEGLPIGTVQWGRRTSYIVRPQSNSSLVYVRESDTRYERCTSIRWPGWDAVVIPQADRFVIRNAGAYLHSYLAFRNISGVSLERNTYAQDQLVTGGVNLQMLGREFGLAIPAGHEKPPRLVTFGLVENGRLGLVEVPLPAELRDGRVLHTLRAVFHRPGHDGPFGLLESGEILNIVDGTKRVLSPGLAPPIKVIEVDTDGSRVLLDAEPPASSPYRHVGRGRFIVDLENGRRTVLAPGFRSLREYDVCMQIRERAVRKSVRMIATDGSTLVLMGRSRKFWRMAIDRDQIVLELDRNFSLNRHTTHSFSPIRRPKPGYRLHRAVWRDSSLAFLDSRGLLHLCSSDPKIPEATLVLHEKNIAGWSTDGRTWGDPYFHLTDQPTTPGATIFREIVQPFAARCAASS